MDKIRNFIELTRGYSVLVSVAPCLLVFSYAHYSEQFTYLNFLLMLIGVICVHLGANLFDDYTDVIKKTKNGTPLNEVKFSSFFAKARLIREGVYSLKQVKNIIRILFLIALLIGIYFVKFSGSELIMYIVTGAVLTLFYPISSRFYLAEATIGFIFGPLVVNGGYWALTKSFNFELFVLSWVIFLTTLVLLQAHNIMDWEFDINEGKKTLCILSGSKKNAIGTLRQIIVLAYVIILIGVANLKINSHMLFVFNPNALYVFLTLPIAVKLLKSLNDYINIKDVKFIPKWYYGPFENWKTIQQNGIDFFMYRFYLARNFAFFFCLFLAIGTMI